MDHYISGKVIIAKCEMQKCVNYFLIIIYVIFQIFEFVCYNIIMKFTYDMFI